MTVVGKGQKSISQNKYYASSQNAGLGVAMNEASLVVCTRELLSSIASEVAIDTRNDSQEYRMHTEIITDGKHHKVFVL